MTSSTPEQDLILSGLPPLFAESEACGAIDWECLDLCPDSASCVTEAPPGSANAAVNTAVPAPGSSQLSLDPAMILAAADVTSSLWPSEQQGPQQPTPELSHQQQQAPQPVSHHEQHQLAAQQNSLQPSVNAMVQPLLVAQVQSNGQQLSLSSQPSQHQLEQPVGALPPHVSSYAPFPLQAASGLSHGLPSGVGAVQESSQQTPHALGQHQRPELHPGNPLSQFVGGGVDRTAPSAETQLGFEELSPALSHPLSDSSPVGDPIGSCHAGVQPAGRAQVATSLSPMSNVSASTGPNVSGRASIASPQGAITDRLAPCHQKHILASYPHASSVLAPATATNQQPVKPLQTVTVSGPLENVSVKAPSNDRCTSDVGRGCAGGGVSKPVPVKQRRRYNKPRSSKYCHLCARHERAVPMIACGNLYRGLCQKSVCRKCFAAYGLDWEAARASLPQNGATSVAKPAEDAVSDAESASASASGANPWLCPHCTGTCPKRAKCFAYDRQTVRRRVKTQEARLHSHGSVR